jgi:hypothetical protein
MAKVEFNSCPDFWAFDFSHIMHITNRYGPIWESVENFQKIRSIETMGINSGVPLIIGFVVDGCYHLAALRELT